MCHLGYTFDHDFEPLTPCAATSACPVGAGESAEATLTSDRVCAACGRNGLYQSDAMPQPRCVRRCGNLQTEISGPTPTSDRICETQVAFVFEGDFQSLAGTPAKRDIFLAGVKAALEGQGVNTALVTFTVREGSVIVTATTRDPSAVAALESARCDTFTVSLGGGSTLPSNRNCASASSASDDSGAVAPWLAAVVAVAAVVVIVIGVVIIRRMRRNGAGKTLSPGTSGLGAVRFSSSAADNDDEGGRVAFSNPMYDSERGVDAYVPEEDGYADLGGVAFHGEGEDGTYMEPEDMAAPGGGDDDDDGGYLTTTGVRASDDDDNRDGGYMDVRGTKA
jgi:hypothetical protein